MCAVRDEEITSSFICDLIVGAHLHCHKEHFTVFIIEQHWTPIHRGLMVNHVIIDNHMRSHPVEEPMV